MEMQFSDLAEIEPPRLPEQWDAALKKVRKEIQLLTATETQSGDNRFKPLAGTSPDDPASNRPIWLGLASICWRTENCLRPRLPPCRRPRCYCSTWCIRITNSAMMPSRRATCLIPRLAEISPKPKLVDGCTDHGGKALPDALLPAIDKAQAIETRLERDCRSARYRGAATARRGSRWPTAGQIE